MTDREKAIVMAYTGYTMLAGDKLGIYYHYVQEKLGGCVMTHELAYKEVQDAIQEAAEEDFIALAKSDNGWISVKDRLPEKLEPVLIYTNDGKMHVGIYNDLYKAFMFPNAHISGRVTDWMSLPEPPKEVSGDDWQGKGYQGA